MKKWPLFRSFHGWERELVTELVSKRPWSEARDVWLKLGLLSVCHLNLTQGELFVGCFLRLSPRSERSAAIWDEPCRVAAGDRELFLVVRSWSFHMKNISLELLLDFFFSSVLSVDLKGFKYMSDTETEGTNLLLLLRLFSFLSGFCQDLLVPFLYLTSLFLFLVSTHPPLRFIDLKQVSGGKYKSSHCHFKQRDN